MRMNVNMLMIISMIVLMNMNIPATFHSGLRARGFNGQVKRFAELLISSSRLVLGSLRWCIDLAELI
jgi:hypothetical protein